MNIEVLKHVLSNNFISTVVGTIAGSITGGGLVLFFDYRRKDKEIRQENFNEAISIQLALQQMLNVSLYMAMNHNDCRTNTLSFYKQLNYQNVDNMWIRFRCIDLHKFYNTYLYIDLDWDLKQFLSDKVGFKRDLLRGLINARALYQHINSLLEMRNPLFDKASELTSNCMIFNPKLFENMRENENLLKILPVKLYAELESVTVEYIQSLPKSIHTIYNAFNQTSVYIQSEFSNSQPLDLSIPDELKNLFNEIIHS